MTDFERVPDEELAPLSKVPETLEVVEVRIQRGAGQLFHILSDIGTGEPLEPLARLRWGGKEKEWVPISTPVAILAVLERLSRGEAIFAEEMAPYKTVQHEYFAGMFRQPGNRHYEATYAHEIYPIARQLDEDLKKKYPALA